MMLLKVKEDRIDFAELEKAGTTEALKDRLKGLASPLLSTLDRRLSELKKQSRLPQHVTIDVDPGFEREWIGIRIKAYNTEDIGTAVTKLDTLLRTGVFRSILELTHGSTGRS